VKSLPWENLCRDNWRNYRLKFAACLKTEKGDRESQSLEYLGLENIESWTGKFVVSSLNDNSSDEKDTLQITGTYFNSSNVLFGKLRPYLAKAFLPETSGICSTEFLVLEPMRGIQREYLFYTLLSKEFITTVNNSTFGSRMPRANWDFIGSQVVPVPPIDDQENIVNYLDRETTEIDALVAEKEQMISLLQEKRNALTNNAVTQGLNPNVALKPSDLDWLGSIPQHWSVKKLGYLASLKSGETITADTIDKQGTYPVYGGNGLRGYTDSFTHSGDYVLIGRQGALCGNINYAHGNFWASEHAVVAAPLEEYDYRWLGSLLHSMNLNQYSLSAAQPGISIDRIGAIKIPVPPLEEQQSIAQYIDREPTQIDSLVTVIKDSIALLKERRSALITAAVTGQIEPENIKNEIR
jgi:type I restriction enzyme, S subunit